MNSQRQTLSPGIALIAGDAVQFFAVSNGTFTVALNLDVVTSDGIASSLSTNLVATSDRTLSTNKTPLVVTGPLVVQSAGVDLLAGTMPTQPGNLYIYSLVKRAGSTLITLLAGYLWTGNKPSFPGVLMPTWQGFGNTGTVAGTAPAAGAEISDTTPAATLEAFNAIVLRFSTTGTAGTRQPGLVQISDGTIKITLPRAPTTTTINTAFQVNYLPGYSINDTAYDANNSVRLSMPDALGRFPPSSTVVTLNTTFIGTDGYLATWYYVEQWFTD